MVRILLDLKKSLEENASSYFDKAKKTRKKIEGAKEALKKSRKKLEALQEKEAGFEQKQEEEAARKARKKEWYEKFRWFLSSDGFVVIGGRDATSNEIVIKKHAEKGDLVFHTDIAGSPFFVIKSEGKEIPKSTIQEAANATTTFSRVWKLGLQSTDVFYVDPEQVSKKAQSGEFLGKGAFMIHGKTHYVSNSIDLAIGVTAEGAIMAGPEKAVTKHCKKAVVLVQGDERVSAIAKKVKKSLDDGDLDEIIRSLPAGEFKIKKVPGRGK